jgi:hypothetical protein
MSVKNFIPTIWSDLIFQAYEKNFVFGQLANRSYEGDVSQFGDTVRVNEIGDMSATAYSGSVTYTEADDAQKVLQIDKKYYIAKKLDDVDNAQTKPKLMGEIARKAGIGLADQVDQSIAALYPQAGITDGSTGSPDPVTSANVIDKLSEMGQAFDENNVPMADRVAVVHPWFVHKLRLAGVDLKTDNTSVYENGSVANVMGWQIFMSNNASNSSTTWYANYFLRRNDTIALAEQIASSEALRLEDQFADAMRWLAVWGVKVMAPESLGILYATNGAES